MNHPVRRKAQSLRSFVCGLAVAHAACGNDSKDGAPHDSSAAPDLSGEAGSTSSEASDTPGPGDAANPGATFPPSGLPMRSPSGHANPAAKILEIGIEQFGTADEDVAWAVSVAGGTVGVGGSTRGALEGTNEGGKDAFIRFDDVGQTCYDQFGTAEGDEVRALTLAVAAGVVTAYATGQTDAGLVPADVGGWDPASGDGFVRVVDAATAVATTTRQFGTGKLEESLTIELQDGTLYLAGGTIGTLGQKKFGDEDNFVLTYDTAGAPGWIRQFGTALFEEVLGLAVDATGFFIVGQTAGDLSVDAPWLDVHGGNGGGVDVFVARFDRTGAPLWLYQFGASGWDAAQAVAIDDDALYVVGRLEQVATADCRPEPGTVIGCDGLPTPPKPAVAAEFDDGFVLKIALDGNKRPIDGGWMDVYGGCQGDTAQGVVLGQSTNGEPELYVVGGHNGGEAHGGPVAGEDSVIRIYDPADGRLREEWILQSASYDRGLDIAQDPDTRTLYVVGQTQGALPGQSHRGSCDAFIAKLPR